MRLPRRIRQRVPDTVRGAIRHSRDPGFTSLHAHYAFAQEGEDGLLARMFEHQARGFYVDVGAHHPTRFSNTQALHARGWRGINIDATPGCMAAFDKVRPEDINLEVAVGTAGGSAELFVFDDPALNSLSKNLSDARHNGTRYSIVERARVPVRPLSEILHDHLPPHVSIDLLTVDVEGRDLDVLESNDWSQFRPDVVMVEVLNASLKDLGGHAEIELLATHGYLPFAKLVNTVVLTENGRWR